MELIKVTTQIQPFTALIELNRPKALNALNPQLMEALAVGVKLVKGYLIINPQHDEQ